MTPPIPKVPLAPVSVLMNRVLSFLERVTLGEDRLASLKQSLRGALHNVMAGNKHRLHTMFFWTL